uniref:Uncharacterized protein n=1 Tax=Oryza punctata TaxID=4537 RepID=A0A0E0MLT7_ORYPU
MRDDVVDQGARGCAKDDDGDTRSRQSLRKMTPKNRCYRTVEDEIVATANASVDHGQRHCGPRGRHSGNLKLDGIVACSMTIGSRVLS